MSKNEKINKVRRTDVLYYRMLIVLCALVAIVFSITYCTNTVEKANNFLLNVAPIVAIVFAVLFLPALVYFIVQRVHGANELHKVLSSGFITLLLLWIASVFWLYGHVSSKKIIAYIIVSAALYFVYYLYNHEFFIFSLFNALGGVMIAMMTSATRPKHIILSAAVIVMSIVCIVLLLVAKKKPVEIGLGKSKFKLADETFNIFTFCISAGLMIAGVILSFILSTASFYSAIVLLAYYLVVTVINTVQMM